METDRWPPCARCVLCGQQRADMVLVEIIERGSVVAPGLYACPEPCAQKFAKRPDAPDWLHDDLRKRGLWR